MYLYPAQVSRGNTSAAIWLPEQDAPEFQNYVIYYRIYLCDTPLSSFETSAERGAVSGNLESHYNTLYPHTQNDTVSSVSLDRIFSNCGYYSLEVEGSTSLSSLLSDPGGGDEIELNFAPSETPYPRITISGTPRYLYRNTDARIQSPIVQALSDRLFFPNFAGWSTTDNNTDLQPRTGSNPSTNTYISLYILAFGIDNNYSPVYSRPEHIGIYYLIQE